MRTLIRFIQQVLLSQFQIYQSYTLITDECNFYLLLAPHLAQAHMSFRRCFSNDFDSNCTCQEINLTFLPLIFVFLPPPLYSRLCCNSWLTTNRKLKAKLQFIREYEQKQLHRKKKIWENRNVIKMHQANQRSAKLSLIVTWLGSRDIIILMNHKNSHKTTTQKVAYKTIVHYGEAENTTRPLFHYGSMHTIPIISKEIIQQKDIKQNYAIKNSHLAKRGPEQEFKRFNSESCFVYPEKMSIMEDDHQKKLKNSTDSKSQYKNSIGSKGSRGSSENDYPKIAGNLKETTSTSSAETMIIQKKQAPAFLKCKSKAMLNKKISDSRLDRDNFKIIKKLGQGKFGRVLMVLQLTTGFMLAMKVVQKQKIIAEGLLEQFIRELKIQAFLKHPNIIQVYGYFEDDKYFYTLMELGCDSQLYNLISQKKKITQQGTSFITKNLLQAVEYMHNLKILHRDIKPENIVRIMGNVKICDFGWAANKMTKDELRSTYCGTPLYLSPEILKGQKYDEKVDLWAIGILAYELLLGKSPFDISQQQDLYKIMTEQVRFPPEKKISKEFQQFIRHILNKNPKERLNSSGLLELKFIRKYEAFQTCQQLCG